MNELYHCHRPLYESDHSVCDPSSALNCLQDGEVSVILGPDICEWISQARRPTAESESSRILLLLVSG